MNNRIFNGSLSAHPNSYFAFWHGTFATFKHFRFGSLECLYFSSPAEGINKTLTFALICGNSIFNGRDGGGAGLGQRVSISEPGR